MPQSTKSSIAVVAAVQAAPFYLNLERSLARALDLIAEAARRRAQLVVFPESWLPGYPAWLDICRDVAVWDHQPTKRIYAQLLENSVAVPSRETAALSEAARKHNLTLVMGLNERVIDGAGRGTLYNSILTIGPTGELLNIRRKLIPTFNERLIWGQGDGSGLRAVETPVGRIGGLICWEHWMPLVRQTLHVAGEDIHVALWPSVKEMYQIASRHYAFEGRCFVVASGGIMRRSDLPREFETVENIPGDDSEFILNGGSCVIGPDGQYVAGPAFCSEVIILARINLDRIREESLTLDVTGHFNRPELFDFNYKGAPAWPNTSASPQAKTEIPDEPPSQIIRPPSLAQQKSADLILSNGALKSADRILSNGAPKSAGLILSNGAAEMDDGMMSNGAPESVYGVWSNGAAEIDDIILSNGAAEIDEENPDNTFSNEASERAEIMWSNGTEVLTPPRANSALSLRKISSARSNNLDAEIHELDKPDE
jgi:predicted amidohydrolase